MKGKAIVNQGGSLDSPQFKREQKKSRVRHQQNGVVEYVEEITREVEYDLRDSLMLSSQGRKFGRTVGPNPDHTQPSILEKDIEGIEDRQEHTYALDLHTKRRADERNRNRKVDEANQIIRSIHQSKSIQIQKQKREEIARKSGEQKLAYGLKYNRFRKEVDPNETSKQLLKGKTGFSEKSKLEMNHKDAYNSVMSQGQFKSFKKE